MYLYWYKKTKNAPRSITRKGKNCNSSGVERHLSHREKLDASLSVGWSVPVDKCNGAGGVGKARGHLARRIPSQLVDSLSIVLLSHQTHYIRIFYLLREKRDEKSKCSRLHVRQLDAVALLFLYTRHQSASCTLGPLFSLALSAYLFFSSSLFLFLAHSSAFFTSFLKLSWHLFAMPLFHTLPQILLDSSLSSSELSLISSNFTFFLFLFAK